MIDFSKLITLSPHYTQADYIAVMCSSRVIVL